MVRDADSQGSQQIERRCRQLGIPLLDLLPGLINPAMVSRIDVDLARRLRAVPVSEEEGQITVAMADPTDARAVKIVTESLGSSIVPVYSSPAAIEAVLESLQEMQAAKIFSYSRE